MVDKDLDRIMVIKSKDFWDAVNEGKYALFCDSNFIGGFENEDEMIKEARKYNKCYALSKKRLIGEGELPGVF